MEQEKMNFIDFINRFKTEKEDCREHFFIKYDGQKVSDALSADMLNILLSKAITYINVAAVCTRLPSLLERLCTKVIPA